MESTSSKPESLKPILLKAGVPLAVSFAGFISAWIIAKKSLSKASSLSQSLENSPETNSPKEPKHEETCHSLSCVEDEENTFTSSMDQTSVVSECSVIHDNPCLEQEIIGLRNKIEGMQMRELTLRLQFDQFYYLKEHDFLLGEIKNKLSLESARVDFLDREISFIGTENKRLEGFAVQYLRVIEQIEYLKSENRMLKRKFQKVLRKSKAQTRFAKEQALKIKVEEAEILRISEELEAKNGVIDKLKDEMRELQRVLNQLQDEKNELLRKLDTEEKSYASKIEAGGVSKEDYKQLIDELEQVKKERTEESNELIYLRWTNACLRHNLTRYHEEKQNQEDRNHIEVEFGGRDEVVHYDSEHEIYNSILEDHILLPSSDEHPSSSAHHHRESACSKRTKLLEKLKRWVEGSEKVRVRHSVYRGPEEHQAPRTRSCSSARSN